MAKLKLGPQFIAYGLIHPFFEMNLRPAADYGRDDDSEVKDTLTSLAANGWVDRETINSFVLTEEQQKLAVEYRKERLHQLESEAEKNEEARDLLFVLNRLWKDGDKIIVPQVGNNMGFRRMRLYPKSQVIRLRLKKEDRALPDQDILEMIPVNVKEYASEEERIADQLIENERAGVGKKEVSFYAKLKAAKPLFESGRNEAYFRKVVFKDGVGQKIYAFLKVNAIQPLSELFVRAGLDPVDPRHVPAQSLPSGELRKLYKDGKIPTVEEVEAVINEAKGPDRNKPKMADRTTIENLRDHNPNPVVKLICGYLLENATSKMNDVLAPMSAHFEEVLRLANSGKKDQLLATLKAM